MNRNKNFHSSWSDTWGKIGLLLSLVVFIVNFFFPQAKSTPQSLVPQMRRQAQEIKEHFTQVLHRFERQREIAKKLTTLNSLENIFSFFPNIVDFQKNEGIALYSAGKLSLWRGKVVNLESLLSQLPKNTSSCLKDKSSVYLLFPLSLDEQKIIVFYRLLAFHPQFKSAYLDDYQIFSPPANTEVKIDYWDFRDNISGFEKFFHRYNDEYVGQPLLQGNIQSLFFPIRNEGHKILATVTLNTPLLTAKKAKSKSPLFSVGLLFLIISLFFLSSRPRRLLTSASSSKEKLLSLAAIGGLIIILRVSLELLSRTFLFQQFSLFSPQQGGFDSFAGLTQSPLDIFLTTLAGISIIAVFFYYYWQNMAKIQKPLSSSWPSLLGQLFLLTLIPGLLFCLVIFLEKLVLNTNLNLLSFRFDPSFFLLHLGILLASGSFLLLATIILHYSGVLANKARLLKIIYYFLLISSYGYVLLRQEGFGWGISQFLLLAFLGYLAFGPASKFKLKTGGVISFSLLLLVNFVVLQSLTSFRNRKIVESSLAPLVLNQSAWGNVLLQESIAIIEAETDKIINLFQPPSDPHLAQKIWKKTPISRLNWYSRLEILDPQGVSLSCFNLNVPDSLSFEDSLPLNQDWQILKINLISFNKKYPYLLAYRDYFNQEEHWGRIQFLLSLDPRNLPFLYSANPYFDLLQRNPLPSLIEVNCQFVILTKEGQLIFNPHRLNFIPPLSVVKKQSFSSPQWISFAVNQNKYHGYFWTQEEKIFGFLLPQKNFLALGISFFKIYILYTFFAFLLLGIFLLATNSSALSFFPSFSTRVYLSFLVIALVPMVLFTFTTRNFFHRLISQQVTERTEIQARFAQQIMQDYFLIQTEGEKNSSSFLPDTLVAWISSAISSDVNLYREGRLIASSRRDFFEYGLLPELIDGEVYYKIRHLNSPLVTQKQKIGHYSFYSLTTGYTFDHKLYLISLPFPLETEEINQTSLLLFEFFLLISFFFIIIVALLARALGQSIIFPIQLLLQATEEVSMGNLEISLTYSKKDEMGTLIDRFNFMVKSLKQHQQELAEMSRKAALAELARKVAHEIKNPLTPIQLSVEHLWRVYQDKREDFDQVLQQSINYIASEVENLRRTAQEFLELSRESVGQRVALDLKEFISRLLQPYQAILEGRITFITKFQGQDFQCSADPARLKTAFRNLITNAIEAIPQQGIIQIEVVSQPQSLEIKVKDTGRGMSPETLHQAFNLYFSTKTSGTGLGLPIARKIIEEHGGKMEITSQESIGTEVKIILPRL